MNPFGTLHRAGVPLALGTDAPVTPIAGWATVRAAVQHWRPDERLSVPVAFDAASRGAHWAGLVDDAGTIAVGGRADLAVWDVGRADPTPRRAARPGGGSTAARVRGHAGRRPDRLTRSDPDWIG